MRSPVAVGGLAVLALLLPMAALAWRRSTRPAQVTDAQLAGLDVPPTDDGRALVTRWRDRSGRWRWNAALPAIAAATATGIADQSGVVLGLGGGPVWTNPLLMGLLAAFVGAIAAELHHLRRRPAGPRPTGPRTAGLAPRSVNDHLSARARTRLAVVAVLAGTVSALDLLQADTAAVPAAGLIAIGSAGIVPPIQRAIVTRPRPALPEPLERADDAVRGLAIRSIDAAGAGLVLLLSLMQSTVLLDTAVATPAGGQLLTGLVTLAGALIALAWWWRAGPAALIAGAARSTPDGVRP